jgi:hypothetical protein
MSALAVRFDAYRTLATGSITGSFVAIGTPTTHVMRLIKIVNNTNADLNISFDGTTNNDFIPANSFALYDLQTNSQSNDYFFLANGTQFYAAFNSGAPTTGSGVYIICVYGKGQ